jgi:Ca2+-binding RTX toxin-like protein
MAATQRNGFKGDANGAGNGRGEGKGDLLATALDDHIMGSDLGDVVDGMEGDDVIIGFAGDDTLTGGAGKDNLSGGEGNDTLVGGSALEGDADEDHFVSGSSFADNGTDTINGYQAEDLVDLTAALGSAYAALDLADDLLDNGSVNLFDAGLVSYDASTGELSVDTDGAGLDDGMNVWFVVSETVEETTGAPEQVAILVGSYTFLTPEAVVVV